MHTKEEATAIFKEQYKNVIKACEELASKKNKKERERQTKHDGTCPSCGSDQVNERIKRIQGEGSLSGSFGGSLLGMAGSLSGSSSMDTNEVNKCNKCNHEWKKYDRDY